MTQLRSSTSKQQQQAIRRLLLAAVFATLAALAAAASSFDTNSPVVKTHHSVAQSQSSRQNSSPVPSSSSSLRQAQRKKLKSPAAAAAATAAAASASATNALGAPSDAQVSSAYDAPLALDDSSQQNFKPNAASYEYQQQQQRQATSKQQAQNFNDYSDDAVSANAPASDNESDAEPALYGSVSGSPGVDFPNYATIPKTSFTCADKTFDFGFYADEETQCQAYHVCWDGRRESFLCGVGTVFNQAILACDYWHSVDCSKSRQFYAINNELGKCVRRECCWCCCVSYATN